MSETVSAVMTELKSYGDEKIKNIFLKHGVKEPFFGVKIEHLKTILKKTGNDHELAKKLYATGNADAMYLAGLMANDHKMSVADLQDWVKKSESANISGYTVPWVAAGSPHGYALALEWIDAKEEYIASAGWSTLSGWVALRPDEELNIPALRKLALHVSKNIHGAPNGVRYSMNGFLIALGVHVKELTAEMMALSKKIGTVMVDMGDTACKVPDVQEYILKAKNKGSLGKKKKTVKC